MAMGRSRITGTRTRLELAWQKEREEQQRLIQESSTLARDLRQTLLEVKKNINVAPKQYFRSFRLKCSNFELDKVLCLFSVFLEKKIAFILFFF